MIAKLFQNTVIGGERDPRSVECHPKGALPELVLLLPLLMTERQVCRSVSIAEQTGRGLGKWACGGDH